MWPYAPSVSAGIPDCQGIIVPTSATFVCYIALVSETLLLRLGARTKQLRLDQQLTLRELAERSGVSLRFLLQIESGRANVSVKRLADVAGALGTSPAALLSESAQPR